MFAEQHTKRLLTGVLCLSVLFLAASFLHAGWQADRLRRLILEHDTAIAALLLSHGVPERTVAASIAGAFDKPAPLKELASSESAPREAVSGEAVSARALLLQTGLSENTTLRLLPALHPFLLAEGTAAAVGCLSFIALFSCLVFIYLRTMEQLFCDATGIVERYAANDFSRQLPELSAGALFLLFSQINTMAAGLKAQKEAESQAKNFLKSTISDISHQLKTPLAALSLYSEIILGEPDNPQAVRAFTEKSQSALRRMEQLTLSLLKLTQLDAGSISFSKTLCPVEDILSQALSQLSDRAEQENKRIDFEGTAGALMLCDPVWTCEAIETIVKNALDHTVAGDTITLACEQTPLALRLSVHDSGCGIAQEDIHHIFKRFYRSRHLPDSRQNSPGLSQGVGLGLPLAKSIIDGQGGTISVESTPGRGTIFTVSLPAKLTEL